MRNVQYIQAPSAPREQTVSISSEGLSEVDLADAIGELERCKVRYVVLPTDAHLNAYRAAFKAPIVTAEQNPTSLLNSLKEADQVCQQAQSEVDRILSALLDLVLKKMKAPKAMEQELETLCNEAKGVMESAMNDINFIAGQHGAHYSAQGVV